VSLRSKDRAAVVQEGIDFAKASDEGGGDNYLFISDSEDEISDEFMVALCRFRGLFPPRHRGAAASRSPWQPSSVKIYL